MDSDSIHKVRVPFNDNGEPLKPTKVTLGLLYVRGLGVDWRNVTSLNCTSLFLDEFLELIRLAPKVTDFVVGIVSGLDYYSFPKEPVTHSQLRKLMITQLRTQMSTGWDMEWDRDDSTMNTLFEKILKKSRCPLWGRSLVNFSHEWQISRWIYPAHLLGFFDRSLPPLRYLSLARVKMNPHEVAPIVACASQLEEVEIMRHHALIHFSSLWLYAKLRGTSRFPDYDP